MISTLQKSLLPAVWFFALIGVFALASSFSDKTLHFFGIAGEREQTISFQYPVEIVQIFGVEGKEINQGQTILEVKRHQLDSDLNIIDQEIKKYQLQKQETYNSITSQITRLNAKKQANMADLDYQIHILELRLKLNTQMMQNITGNKSPVHANTELRDLKRKRHYTIKAIQTEIDHLQTQLNSSNRPIDAQINELLKRKQELQRQNTGLTVTAKMNGRIGSVNFKTGDLVSPYQPIMSVHSRVPQYIKGYINENVINNVKIGETVRVKSLAFAQDDKPLFGIVESMGNRIVEYPERLKKNPAIPAWGREVVVRLKDPKHSLLFGEKVEVFLKTDEQTLQSPQFITSANAASKKIENSQTIRPIYSKNPDLMASTIEASGVLWNPAMQHYLLISDEQYHQQTGIFIMNEQGNLSSVLSMFKDQKIDDLESISTDDNYIYILSSLSYNKHDHLKNKRKKFIRFKYKDAVVSKQQAVDLYTVLKKIEESQPPGELKTFLKLAIKNHSLDIEAHFVKENALYLGFKSPLNNAGKTVILKLTDVESIFSGHIPRAQIWQTVQLLNPDSGEPMLLSDMISLNDQLFLLSVSRSDTKNSVLWHFQPEHGVLRNIQQFPGLKAEGLSYRPDKSEFIIVFDEGRKSTSKYTTLTFSLL